MISLAKTVPKGIRDKECKRFTLQECPPVPYVLEKDPVQETVSALQSDQSLKITIREMQNYVLFTYYLCTARRLMKLVTQIRFTLLLGICLPHYLGMSGLM
jgi:hypothetical protein